MVSTKMLTIQCTLYVAELNTTQGALTALPDGLTFRRLNETEKARSSSKCGKHISTPTDRQKGGQKGVGWDGTTPKLACAQWGRYMRATVGASAQICILC